MRGWLDQDGFGGRMDRAWPGLLETVRTGKTSYEHVFGLPLWDDVVAHPEVAASFNALMVRQSEDVWRGLSQVYDWSRVLTLSEGRARTLSQLRAIVEAAGLELVRTYPLPSGRYALECAPPGRLC